MWQDELYLQFDLWVITWQLGKSTTRGMMDQGLWDENQEPWLRTGVYCTRVYPVHPYHRPIHTHHTHTYVRQRQCHLLRSSFGVQDADGALKL